MNNANLVLRNVTVTIEGRIILDKISLELGPGIHGLVGPNGAGKTTLLKSIAGIIDYEGEILYNGKVLDSLNVAYSPATPIVDPLALVSDILKAGVYNSRGDYQTALRYLQQLGLSNYLDRRYSSLSSGEQRLVWIARTLGRKARVVLLDEPLSFLDVRNQSLLLETLKRYVKEHNAIVVLTTHEIHYVWYFDSVSVVNKGVLVYSGEPSKLTKEILENTYNVQLYEVRSDEGIIMYIPRVKR